MKKLSFSKRLLSAVSAFLLFAAFIITPSAKAAEDPLAGTMVGFMMSPMTERVQLKPGESHTGYFYLMNPDTNTITVGYNIEVRSFYRDEGGNAIFEDVAGRNMIKEWITIDSPMTGTLDPGVSTQIFYTINVPFDAPGGGQYAAITATSMAINNGSPIEEAVAMNYTIFTEVEGDTIRSGEITDLSLPTFLPDGNIIASSNVKNTGNVHGNATYTLKVYPLFSDSPIYSNENDPDKRLVLPDRTITNETVWKDTPAIGIFNVSYKVEFEGGETKEIQKFVIKCPIWLLLIILLVLACVITFISNKIKSYKKPVENS